MLVSELCGSVPTQVVFFGQSTSEDNASVSTVYKFREPSIGLPISEKKSYFVRLFRKYPRYMIDSQ